MVTSVSTLTDKVTNQGLPIAKNVGRQIPDWDSILIHEGSMKKQGGLGNSWMHRLFHLYRTCQGSFLCYYDNEGQTPPFSKDVKARNIIDISKVTQIRARSMLPNAPEHAFDLVTVERDFTFVPETGDIAAYWLRLLARATEEDVAVVPDEEFAFKLKVVQDSIAVFDGSIIGQDVFLLVTQAGLKFYATIAHVQPIVTFKYTELYKWSAQVIQEYHRSIFQAFSRPQTGFTFVLPLGTTLTVIIPCDSYLPCPLPLPLGQSSQTKPVFGSVGCPVQEEELFPFSREGRSRCLIR
jgi:hypothetical protein